MVRRWTTILALLAVGCESTMFIDRVWDENEPAVLIVTDKYFDPMAPSPRLILPGKTATLELSAPDEIQIFIRTYEKLSKAPDLSTCELRLGGSSGVSADPVTSAWTSGLIDSELSQIEMTTDNVLHPFNLMLNGCGLSSDECPEVLISVVEIDPFYEQPISIVALSDSRALLIGSERSETDNSTLVARIDGTNGTLLPADSRVTGRGIRLAREGNAVVGASAPFNIFRLDVEGRVTDNWRASFGPDGPVSGMDTTLMVERMGDIHRLVAGSTTTEPFPPLPGGAGTAAPGRPVLYIVRSDRMIGGGMDRGVHQYDGNGWTRVLALPIAAEPYKAVAGDEGHFFVFDWEEQAFLFDDESGKWRSVGTPYVGQNVSVVESLGKGRFLSGGQAGTLELWNGARWCSLMAGTTNDFVSLSTAPSAPVVYAVTHHNDPAGSAILRIELVE